jgi:hypothetical protein
MQSEESAVAIFIGRTWPASCSNQLPALWSPKPEFITALAKLAWPEKSPALDACKSRKLLDTAQGG